mmetsp:Transcript_1448/g.2498  ORF Transcript_1448/g.2498 Transcript_1448/m.2498 type:complete len:313 (-) Transcript_1448:8-946(-)
MKALIRKAKEDGRSRNGIPASKLPTSERQAADGPVERPLPLPAALAPVGEQHRIGNVPSVWLVEEWLPMEVEAQLLENLRARSGDFIQLRGKRTARFGGDPGPPFNPEPLPGWLVQICSALEGAVGYECNDARGPNHVLVNRYQPGEGIMPHTDGPAYDPRAAILALGSATVFDFWRDHAHAAGNEGPSALSLLLPPRSLLVFADEAYGAHLHGIAARRYDELDEDVVNWTADSRQRWDPNSVEAPDWVRRQIEGSSTRSCGLRREERYSLTCRHVPLSQAEATAAHLPAVEESLGELPRGTPVAEPPVVAA